MWNPTTSETILNIPLVKGTINSSRINYKKLLICLPSTTRALLSINNFSLGPLGGLVI